MSIFKLRIPLFLVVFIAMFLFLCSNIYAYEYKTNNVDLIGLTYVKKNTILNVLRANFGDQLNSNQSSDIIKILYTTGFFENIFITENQKNKTLVIKFQERPLIKSVNYDVGKYIQKDDIEKILKKTHLSNGEFYSNNLRNNFTEAFDKQFADKYYADFIVKNESKNMLDIDVKVQPITQEIVKKIFINGNHVFATKILLRNISLKQKSIFSFITGSDKFSKERLNVAKYDLESYYMNRGYADFKILSAYSVAEENKKYVNLYINLSEGSKYTFDNYSLFVYPKNLPIDLKKLQDAIDVTEGKVFSRSKIEDSVKNISYLLGNLGYAFAKVIPIPDINNELKKIKVTFIVMPGSKVYVRKIIFNGNNKTHDTILRHSIKQLEGSIFSSKLLDESVRNLNLLGYLSNVNYDVTDVKGVSNQVDVTYNVTENPSSQFLFNIGYGTNGMMYGASLSHDDFLGTGRSIGINFNKDNFTRNISIDYSNPYYTDYGVQRKISIYSQKLTPEEVNITSYNFDTTGASVDYLIPISAADDALDLGYGYRITNLHIGIDSSQQIYNFVKHNGKNFREILLDIGWTKNNLDRLNFPTDGTYQKVSNQISLPGSTTYLISYYKTNYLLSFYYPLYKSDYIFNDRFNFGYGNGFGRIHYLPFFANYYAGGPEGFDGQVRGYAVNTLGPKDSLGQPLGGNVLLTGTTSLIFPNHISDSLRTSLFLDYGNTYTTFAKQIGGTDAGPMRYSAGIGAQWRVPFFNVVLSFSLAAPIHARKSDIKDQFQFNIGGNL